MQRLQFIEFPQFRGYLPCQAVGVQFQPLQLGKVSEGLRNNPRQSLIYQAQPGHPLGRAPQGDPVPAADAGVDVPVQGRRSFQGIPGPHQGVAIVKEAGIGRWIGDGGGAGTP